MIYVWQGLRAARHISRLEKVGGINYQYWDAMLSNITDEELRHGLQIACQYSQTLTLGKFHEMCKAYQPPPEIPDNQLAITPQEQFLSKQEISDRVRALRDSFRIPS